MTRPASPDSRPAVRRRFARLGAALAAAWCISGCLILRSGLQAGEPLPGASIRGIERGATTRGQIVERFGPPTAVARQGEAVLVPFPGPVPRGRQTVRPDGFFELFSSRRALRPAEIVLYYETPRIEETGVIFVPIVGGGHIDRHVVLERLWLLIDEDTGTVQDYAFRGAE